jgi:cation diffusion facilitator CzcD-associated flavoprotein CzcO
MDMSGESTFDAVVIGAGFAGMAMVNRLYENGFTVQGFETGGDVGGTWYWNRYPGARCDVPSMEYSYRFSEKLQQEWEWREHYAPQGEILEYANHVADRFGLRRFFKFNTNVDRAEYDEAARRWRVYSSDGAVTVARFLITAVGCLSAANTPDIPGLEDFAGQLVHTGQWPHEGVDFTGKRAGVIGTGSSGVQSIPIIAREAETLVVFQRTAAYCAPAHNRALSPEKAAEIKRDYKAFRDQCGRNPGAMSSMAINPSALDFEAAERRRRYDAAWEQGGLAFTAAFSDLTYSLEANETARQFYDDKIHELVHDPKTAAKLVPKHLFGVKRLCIDTDYYVTYNRPNVHLVDLLEEPIERVTAEGVQTRAGNYSLDILVLATGYDALTGPLLRRIDLHGRGRRTLREAWADGAHSYLGLAVAGFPNMFTISGPGSPSVLTNMVYSLEQHVDWISACLVHLRSSGIETIEAEASAQANWGAELNAISTGSLMVSGDSWYTGANIPGKPRSFMVHLYYPGYVERCEAVAANGYDGFSKTPLAAIAYA